MNNKNFNNFLRDLINDDFSWTTSSTLSPYLLSKMTNVSNNEEKNYSQNAPATNVYEDEWSYRYELSTPGFTKKDLNVELTDNLLLVSGEVTVNKKDKGEYISREYYSNKFYRSFTLPENVVGDEIHAKVENGVTTLFLPKVTPTKKNKTNRTIEIG
jgi:HSP20 family protein